MKVAVRENYVDCFATNRFSEEELKKEPYNFQIIEVPNSCLNCCFEDFDLINGVFVFNKSKYDSRMKKDESKIEIDRLKLELAQTDYLAIKFAEGLILEEDYKQIKEQREAKRVLIRQLEKYL